jgi:hypothetical protein
MIDKLVGKAVEQPIQLAIGVGIVVGIAYFLVKHVGAEAAKAGAGLVTGDNALTKGTPYQNKGVVGTIAAAANAASGNVLQSIGESVGGWLYDVTHPSDYDPSTGLTSGGKTVAQGAANIDALWGRDGQVDLRHQAGATGAW